MRLFVQRLIIRRSHRAFPFTSFCPDNSHDNRFVIGADANGWLCYAMSSQPTSVHQLPRIARWSERDNGIIVEDVDDGLWFIPGDISSAELRTVPFLEWHEADAQAARCQLDDRFSLRNNGSSVLMLEDGNGHHRA